VHGFTKQPDRFNSFAKRLSTQYEHRKQPPPVVDVYDMSPLFALDRADFYEAVHVVTALQGIVNRFAFNISSWKRAAGLDDDGTTLNL
jgi:hypothetical protein